MSQQYVNLEHCISRANCVVCDNPAGERRGETEMLATRSSAVKFLHTNHCIFVNQTTLDSSGLQVCKVRDSFMYIDIYKSHVRFISSKLRRIDTLIKANRV